MKNIENGIAATNHFKAAHRPVTPVENVPLEQLAKLPPWLESMRSAMLDAIKPSDLTEILTKQVEKAKSGDVKSAAFVMDQAQKLVAGEQRRPVTITQNNFYGADPSQPTKSVPGSGSRINQMRSRVAVGLPPIDPNDRDPRVVSDEQEKLIRRAEADQDAS